VREAPPEDTERCRVELSSSLRSEDMSCVKVRDAAGSNCSTSVNGFFSPNP